MLLGLCIFLTVLPFTKGCTLVNNKKISKITAHVGEAVLLPCSCSNNQRTNPRTEWRKTKPQNDWQSVPISEDRFQLFNVSGNFSLLISHLTKEDGGLYRCDLKYNIYTDFNLTVKGQNISEQPDPMRNAFFFFIPVVLLLLGLGGVIFWRHRAKKREQTPSRKEPTEQRNEEETQRKDQETQDDIMYTTVVHTNTTPRPKEVSTGEQTEYSIIKLHK